LYISIHEYKLTGHAKNDKTNRKLLRLSWNSVETNETRKLETKVRYPKYQIQKQT